MSFRALVYKASEVFWQLVCRTLLEWKGCLDAEAYDDKKLPLGR